MIAIRTYLPSLLTFPGVIFRQMIHMGFCRILGVKVLDVRFFRYDTPAGYVLHEIPKRFGTTVLLALGPLLLHSLLCVALCLPVLVPCKFYHEAIGPLSVFQLWLGLSIGMHAFQSARDADTLWEQTRCEVSNHGAAVRVLLPLLVLLRLARRFTNFGFDVVYALVIGVWIPYLLLDRFFHVL